MEKFPSSVLVCGSLLSQGGNRVLEIRTGSQGQETGVVLLVDGALPARRSFLRMEVIPAADLRLTRIVLRGPAVGHESTKGEVSRRQAIPSVAASVLRLGRDAAASLDFFLRVAHECPEYHRIDRLDGASSARTAEDPSVLSRGLECSETVPGEDVAVAEGQDFWPETVPDLLLRKVEAGWLAVNPTVGRVLLLNDSSAAVLKLFDGDVSLYDLVSAAAESFTEDPQVMEGRLRKLIESCLQSGLLILRRQPREESDAA